MTVFASVGFDITLLEYFSENGVFHYHEWNPDDGMITRSKRFDSRNATRELTYTSIILDARKPIRSTNATSRPLVLPAVAVSLAALALVIDIKAHRKRLAPRTIKSDRKRHKAVSSQLMP